MRHREQSSVLCDDLRGRGGGGGAGVVVVVVGGVGMGVGWEAQAGADIGAHMPDLPCCAAETHTPL